MYEIPRKLGLKMSMPLRRQKVNGTGRSAWTMTGLEEVKAQVLKIKARADTALRQNTNVKDERYGIVLLGNPGTGKVVSKYINQVIDRVISRQNDRSSPLRKIPYFHGCVVRK